MKFATTGVAKNKALVTTDWIGIEFRILSSLAGIQPYFCISKRTISYFSSNDSDICERSSEITHVRDRFDEEWQIVPIVDYLLSGKVVQVSIGY